MLTLLTRNIAHAEYRCGQNIEKVKVEVYRPRVHLQSSNPEFFSVLDTSFFNMDTQSSSRRGLKSVQEHEDRRRHRNERERDNARCTAQTASENEATSQRKSTHECERMAAETPEERQARLHRRRDRLAVETLEDREAGLQQMSTNQCKRFAVEASKKREMR